VPVNYESMYNQSMGLYGGILGGYASALQQQQAAQQNVMAGYNNLQSTVLGGLAGQGQARSADLAANYTMRQGREMQNLISRGLGNSTIQSSVTRGLAFDEQRAQNSLAEDVARQNAEYQSRLGLASLGYQAQAAQQNMALLGQQLNYQSGWQSNLLGSSLQGMGREDAYRNQMINRLGGGGISGGSSGAGGYGTGRSQGRGYAQVPMANKPELGASYPGWTPAGAGYMNFGGEASPNSFWGDPYSGGPYVGGGLSEGPGYLLGAVAGGGVDAGYSGSAEEDPFWYGGD
jgi:hypothetical protein